MDFYGKTELVYLWHAALRAFPHRDLRRQTRYQGSVEKCHSLQKQPVQLSTRPAPGCQWYYTRPGRSSLRGPAFSGDGSNRTPFDPCAGSLRIDRRSDRGGAVWSARFCLAQTAQKVHPAGQLDHRWILLRGLALD